MLYCDSLQSRLLSDVYYWSTSTSSDREPYADYRTRHLCELANKRKTAMAPVIFGRTLHARVDFKSKTIYGKTNTMNIFQYNISKELLTLEMCIGYFDDTSG